MADEVKELEKVILGETEKESNEREIITPSEYFLRVKEKQNKVTDKYLNDYYDNCIQLINKYKKTGQQEALKKLIFVTECVERERLLITKDIDTFVYRDDIFEYINDMGGQKYVKITELKNFTRDIPNEVFEKYDKVKDIFDEFFVLFTDYTGTLERKVEEEQKEKDPILFGVFVSYDKQHKIINDKMYVIGDWVDEYCDLTMDKLINEFAKKDKQVEYKIKEPLSLEELKREIYETDKSEQAEQNTKNTENFFNKFKSWFKK